MRVHTKGKVLRDALRPLSEVVYTLCTSYEYLYKDGCVASDCEFSSGTRLENRHQNMLCHP